MKKIFLILIIPLISKSQHSDSVYISFLKRNVSFTHNKEQNVLIK